MMVDAVRTVVVLFLQYISDNFAMEYDRVHHKAFALCQRDDALETWEACFAFLEWVVDHEDQFHGKRILEVGSGSGLCGQMIQCLIRDCSVVMSDYCADVTEYILGNIEESSFEVM